MVPYTGTLNAYVKIEAQSCMTFTDFKIYRNGKVVKTLPVKEWKPVANTAIRYEGMFPLEVSQDSWFLLEVTGKYSGWPLCSVKPYAITNPIYVDFDGNGTFDAPKSKYGI
jgi:hypothetical protein